MTSRFMSISEAATYLDVSRRTLTTYLAKGFLSCVRRAGSNRKWLDPQEVEELRRARTEATTSFTRKDLLLLRAKVQRLESQMEVVLRILDSKAEPLRMSPEYARDLYGACLSQLKMTLWNPAEVGPWVEVFLRINEEDFETLAKATDDKRPWKPFLKLCVAMTASITTAKEYETSLELQVIHRKLAEARRRIRVSALVYSEMNTGTDPDLGRYALAESSIADVLEGVLRVRK